MRTTNAVIIFLTLFIFNNANAQSEQTEITIPKFTGTQLVLRTLEATGWLDPTLTISDGSEVHFSLRLQIIKPRNEVPTAKILAVVLNQLKSQGYKLITSNSGGGAGSYAVIVTTYIFQKE